MSDYRNNYPAIGFQPLTCGNIKKIWKTECPQYGINRVCCKECNKLPDCDESCLILDNECDCREYNFVGPDAIRVDKTEIDELCKIRTPYLEDLDMLPGPLYCCSNCEYIEPQKKCDAGILDDPKFYTTIEFLDVTCIRYFAIREGVLIVWSWKYPEKQGSKEEETGDVIIV